MSSSRTLLLFVGLLYIPGVFLHELGHFLAAVILRVPVYGFSIFPRVTKTGIIFGQVKIAKVGFFRRALIATAPFFLGSGCLFVCIYILFETTQSLAVQLLLGYLVLCTINMMLPSKRDIAVIFGR